MNVYFAASTSRIRDQESTFRSIIARLQDQGATVLPSWIVETLNGAPVATDSRALLQRQQALLKRADVIVAEVSTPSLGVGAMIMFGIEQRIPILCLYPDTAKVTDISQSIQGLASSLVSTRSYNSGTLQPVLQKFLARSAADQFRRFNFIANQEIAEFIETGARREQKTKSEFLRDFISSYMDDYKERYDPR